MKAFTALLHILLVSSSLAVTCRPDLPVVEKCCPEDLMELCCPQVPICFSKSKNHLTPPNPCPEGDNDLDCKNGFSSYLNGTIVATPGGFLSPAGIRCAQPCLDGSYCPLSILQQPSNFTISQCVESSKCCRYADGAIADVKVELIQNQTKLICPGSQEGNYCPESYYCPDASTKVPCPDSGQCPKGITKPLECNHLYSCNTAEGGYSSRLVAILWLVILLIVVVGIFTAHLYRREMKGYLSKWLKLNGKNNTTTNAIAFGLTNLALKPLKEADNQAMERIEQVIDISFSNVNYETKDRQILHDVFGAFKHGNITAVMGPSGCGKTTIMNILRGKLRENVTGDIRWNGESLSEIKNYKSVIGYAPQEDIIHARLTVKEVLMYRANITCSSWDSKSQQKEFIQTLMSVLGLSSIADTLVGGEEERGISGGQKRRLNVGMELVGNPTILFCDEPTSGLDSSTSLGLIQTLRSIAETSGINIICVIHQPRYECFALFHNLLLLSSGGRVVYEGEAALAQEYFKSHGFAMLPFANPADYIIDIANGASVSGQCDCSDLPELWVEKCKEIVGVENAVNMSTATLVHTDIDPTIMSENTFAPPRKPSWWQQFFWLLKREALLQIRTASLFVMELAIAVLLGGILGAMYMKPDIRNQIGKLAMASLCIGILTVVVTIKYVGNNWENVLRESDAGVNRLSYYLAVNVLSLPTVVVMIPLSFLSVYHTISDTRTTFSEHFTNFVAAVFAASGYALLVSCLVPHRKMYIVAVGTILLLVFSGGSTMPLCDMHEINFFGPAVCSISFARWFIEAQYECESRYYSDALASSVHYYARRGDYTLDNRTTCLCAMVMIGMVTRVLGFLAIVFRTK